MTWKIRYSLRQSSYLRRRFFQGLSMAVLIVYGVMVALILLGLDAIQTQGFFVSGYGYMFVLVSFIFWLITLIIALTKMTTYVASYQMTDKHIRMKVKAEKDRSALLGFFDFINTATYGSNPANFSIHRLGSQGSMKVSWRNIRSIRLIERHKTMILKGKPGEKMPIYFQQENQKILLDFLKEHCPEIGIKTL